MAGPGKVASEPLKLLVGSLALICIIWAELVASQNNRGETLFTFSRVGSFKPYGIQFSHLLISHVIILRNYTCSLVCCLFAFQLHSSHIKTARAMASSEVKIVHLSEEDNLNIMRYCVFVKLFVSVSNNFLYSVSNREINYGVVDLWETSTQ